jgi:LacI family transcriptional regulator
MVVNLKQLAQIVGLSQTTVSRALGGYPEVRETTRLRVQEAARAHDYRPSRRATSLATGRSMAIGHVIPMSNNHEMVNPVFSDFIAGAGEVYARSGYDMLLSVVRDQDEMQAYRDLATKGAVDGIILHGPRQDDPRIDLLTQIGLPFVVHGRATQSPAQYSFVDINNFSAFRRATDLLLDLGHRRIALVNGLERMDFARRRRAGYEQALTARGLHPDPILMSAQEMTEHYGHSAACALLDSSTPPTAFLVSSIISAIGVRRALHDRGLVLGRNVSIVTHDDALSYLGNGRDVPIFTATQSSVRDAGRRCAEILLAQIRHGVSMPPVQEVWECALHLGHSTGPVHV